MAKYASHFDELEAWLRAIRTGTADARGIVDEPLAFLEPSKVRPPKAALDEIMESFR